jgi:hypothetical protein
MPDLTGGLNGLRVSEATGTEIEGTTGQPPLSIVRVGRKGITIPFAHAPATGSALPSANAAKDCWSHCR